jgi:purine-binding chemotaxis protein CheW
LPVEAVSEVMRPLPVEPVSGMPPFASGLCVIRGTPLPVIDAGALLVGSRISPTRLVTLMVGARSVALAVESVLGVRQIDPASVGRLPPLLSSSGNAVEALRALDGELLLMLDAARLVPHALLDELNLAGSRA